MNRGAKLSPDVLSLYQGLGSMTLLSTAFRISMIPDDSKSSIVFIISALNRKVTRSAS
jgi:hypothetical protein